MNDTSAGLPNLELHTRQHTYQGAAPTCSADLGQAAGASKTRGHGYWWNGTNWAYYLVSPLASNSALGAVADSDLVFTSSSGGWPVQGYWYFNGGYEWTAYSVYYHYDSPDTPTDFFCRTDLNTCG